MPKNFSDAELDVVRRGYARQMLTLAEVAENTALERAFAAVRREDFLGPPPWKLLVGLGHYRDLEPRDAVAAYQDVLFAIDPARRVNNGSPSLHARWLDALAPRPGERVAHIGAGTGYYTAILAELVGPEGAVTAVEIDHRLASAARRNLAAYGNVSVVEGDGTRLPEGPVDAVYVNFGVERPMPAWIAALREGGRLVLPLGTCKESSVAGGGFLITRRGAAFAARYLCRCFFVAAEDAVPAPPGQRARLDAAFAAGGMERVKSFLWGRGLSGRRCWFAATDWAFSYETVP